jgi:hypothetical protein
VQHCLPALWLSPQAATLPAAVGRSPGWQNTIAGEREVKKALRKTLLA